MLAALALALLLAAVGAGVAAQTTEVPAVVGQVTNGTPGSSVPAGLPVMLHFFGEGGGRQTYTTTLTAEGTFRFDDRPADAGGDAVVQVTYQGVDYVSGLALGEAEAQGAAQAETRVDVLIFEPTADPSGVQVDQGHLFLVPADAWVQVAEYYLLGNAGDRTYVGAPGAADGRTTLRFDLPPGAQELMFDGPGLGERFVAHEAGGFSDTRPIVPGTRTLEVGFSYRVPYRPRLSITRTLAVPMASVVLLVSGDRVRLAGPDLAFDGMVDTQMGAAASYVAGPLVAGEALAFTLVPQPASGAATDVAPRPAPAARSPRREIGLGITAVGLAGLVSYWLWQPDPPPAPPSSVRPLIAEIARLDREVEAGALEEAAGRQQRAALKAHLLRMLQDPPGVAPERPIDERPIPMERTSGPP
jgi:hypothetical protein